MKPHERLAIYVKEYYDWCCQERQNLLEDTWNFCYDAFKGEYRSENIARWKKLEGHEWRSKFFVRLTKQKVVAVVSQIEDVENQGGKLPWDIAPTEYPEGAPGTMLDPKVADLRCRAMKKRIESNLTKTDAENHFWSSLLEMALYGMSWLRSPVIRPVTAATVSFDSPVPGMYFPPELMAQFGEHGLQFVTEQIPTVEHLNLWDMFWDLESADHQTGKGIVHRVMMSAGEFLRLADRNGYDKDAINSVAQPALTQMRSAGADPSEGPYQAKLQYRLENLPSFLPGHGVNDSCLIGVHLNHIIGSPYLRKRIFLAERNLDLSSFCFFADSSSSSGNIPVAIMHCTFRNAGQVSSINLKSGFIASTTFHFTIPFSWIKG